MNKYIYKVRFVTLNFLYITITKNSSIIIDCNPIVKFLISINASCLLHENYMFTILIIKLHILKFHRKTILQQTPSSNIPTSG